MTKDNKAMKEEPKIEETKESITAHKAKEKAEMKESETLHKPQPFEEELKAEKDSIEKKEEKPKKEKEERAAIAYIYSSPNNTIVHITDLAGNTLARVSGGMVTKHSRLKADPTIAMFAAKRAAERAKDFDITSLYIRTRAKTRSPGIGPGAHAAVKTLSKEGFKIINILDTTRVPRGGPKKKGGKRGRRV
ncbi:MAG: 30S ribosomal protein S11 [Candidatus Pacearchaeota archaeon]|nr:30S ribosomal protein S11 [Candidatus Pacearchaeota archaeon]